MEMQKEISPTKNKKENRIDSPKKHKITADQMRAFSPKKSLRHSPPRDQEPDINVAYVKGVDGVETIKRKLAAAHEDLANHRERSKTPTKQDNYFDE